MLTKLINWCRARKEASFCPEKQIFVELNDQKLVASYPDGERFTVDLNNLSEIKIMTNDSGPWGADVWYSFSSLDSRCIFPQGATGEEPIIDFLFNMEGFNESEFIKAMRSTSNSEFICWKRK